MGKKSRRTRAKPTEVPQTQVSKQQQATENLDHPTNTVIYNYVQSYCIPTNTTHESRQATDEETPSKQEIIDTLLENYEKGTKKKYSKKKFRSPNDNNWTIADLFLQQYLNSMSDGFGMENVHEMFDYLVKNKRALKKYNLVSRDGYNNAGVPLWENYDFDKDGKHSDNPQAQRTGCKSTWKHRTLQPDDSVASMNATMPINDYGSACMNASMQMLEQVFVMP